MGTPPVAFTLEICLHHVCGLLRIPLVAQYPHHLHQRNLGKHIPALYDPCRKQVPAGIIDAVADPALHALGCHHDKSPGINQASERGNKVSTHMPEPGTRKHEPLVALVCPEKIGRHPGIKLEKTAPLLECVAYAGFPASPPDCM